jgi:hypothetical protein
MPVISTFYGILIYMYWNDHAPPHFHAKYGEFQALINIKDFSVIEGKLPPKALGLVVEWASIHREELLENWELGIEGKTFKKIEPLN